MSLAISSVSPDITFELQTAPHQGLAQQLGGCKFSIEGLDGLTGATIGLA